MEENLEFNDYLFKDRADACNALLEILPIKVMRHEKWILLALSGGGVEITVKLAQRYGFDFDLLFSEAIYAPNNDECQLAMVSESKDIVIEEKLVNSFGISFDYIYEEAQELYHKYITKYQHFYRKGLGIADIKDKNVMLIDEGCESGFIAMCALKSVINMGAKKVAVAVPLMADDLFGLLDMKADKVYTVHQIKDFIEVSYYYRNLPQPKPKKVREMIEDCRQYLPFKKGDKE